VRDEDESEGTSRSRMAACHNVLSVDGWYGSV
jgi:hypothetical protein